MKQLTKLLLLSLFITLLPTESIAQKSGSRRRKRSSAPAVKKVTSVSNEAIARAFATRTSNVQVEGEGKVIRLLSDDVSGSRHQRFIVELASGQTLLITHNTDIAPRIDGLEVGDTVRFSGEYVWNEKGGVIHWTHHDPQGRHVAGWVIRNGRTYN